MSTRAQAKPVADATGGKVVYTDEGRATAKAILLDLDHHSAFLEAVLVCFKPFEGRAKGFPLVGSYAAPSSRLSGQGGGALLVYPLASPSKAVCQELGACPARGRLAARQEKPSHQGLRWRLEALRKRWNQVKAELAPWWAFQKRGPAPQGSLMPSGH
jgi:putative transposase